jgi:hypothetical protein
MQFHARVQRGDDERVHLFPQSGCNRAKRECGKEEHGLKNLKITRKYNILFQDSFLINDFPQQEKVQGSLDG